MKHSRRHGRTPQAILEDPELHSEAVRIYGLMAMWVFQGNVCRKGLRYLAKCIKKSPATAQRRVRQLIASGLISQGKTQAGERAYYVLNHPIFGKKQRSLDAGETITEDLVSFPRRRLATARKAKVA